MAWSGGNFTRTNGVNTGTQVWQDDRDAATKILATLHDAHDQDLANGIQNCLTKDGQNSPTADINFGGFHLTNLAAGSSANDSVRYGQVLLADGTNAATGDLAMGSNKITGLAAGTATGHAVNYDQVLLADGTNAATGNLAMGTNKITGLGTPTAGTDAATKDYADSVSAAGGQYMLAFITGLTMSGTAGTFGTGGASGTFGTKKSRTITESGGTFTLDNSKLYFVQVQVWAVDTSAAQNKFNLNISTPGGGVDAQGAAYAPASSSISLTATAYVETAASGTPTLTVDYGTNTSTFNQARIMVNIREIV